MADILTEAQAAEQVHRSLGSAGLEGKRVLALIPDRTRTAPIPFMFKEVCSALLGRVKALDFMVALGTHAPMSEPEILQHVGITQEQKERAFRDVRLLNHIYNDPMQLVSIGCLSEDEVERVSNGLFRMTVNLTINKVVFDYDHILIIGPVFPHEVVGYSGGYKYLFPGISGVEIIDFFHWLGAVITNPQIIGLKRTPVRDVVDMAGSRVPVDKSCFAMVVDHEGLKGLFYGTPEEAWSKAADLSSQTHVKYVSKPYNLILSCAPSMYDDIWVAGKCMYKLEPVLADGGTLIIYAPHITEVSHTHGRILDEIGYHVRDYFVCQWDRFKHYPWGVLAHSTHVKGIGTYVDGIEKPRANVVLATRIPEERCQRINLGYLDYREIDQKQYLNRESEGVLCVQKAGEVLYRLEEK